MIFINNKLKDFLKVYLTETSSDSEMVSRSRKQFPASEDVPAESVLAIV